jgi:hypothetical protein
MNTPQFKIHGKERRALKKKLSEYQSIVKYFWHCHSLDKDMTSIYGGNENYPMDDTEALLKFNKINKELENIKELLSIRYGNT